MSSVYYWLDCFLPFIQTFMLSILLAHKLVTIMLHTFTYPMATHSEKIRCCQCIKGTNQIGYVKTR